MFSSRTVSDQGKATPPQFIALCEASGASPQATLRGMAAMLCGLRYDAESRLVQLDGAG